MLCFFEHGLAAFDIKSASARQVFGSVLASGQVNTLVGCPGPFIPAGLKISVPRSLLTCTLVQKNGGSEWIGAVLFCISVVLLMIVVIQSLV